MSNIHSNPDPTESDPTYSGFKATLLGRGASGTILWFTILTAAVIAITLAANRCDNDDSSQSVNTASATPTPAPTEMPAPPPTAAPTPTETPEPTATPTPEPTPSPTPALEASRVNIDTVAGSVTLTGSVPDVGTKTDLVARVTVLVGESRVIDELTIDPDLTNDGATITVSGSAEEATGTTLVESLLDNNAGTDVDSSGLTLIASIDVVSQLNDSFAINPIRFATGSADILPESRPVLDDVAATLGQAPGLSLVIEGHTDSTGDPQQNLQLSLARAEAVLDYLVDAGISRETLSAEGLGDTDPIADNGTEAGRLQNRRIEFQIEP